MKLDGKGVRKNIMHVLGGTVLTEDFFLKNTRFIITLFIIMVLYISNRYSCNTKLSTIERLEHELKDVRYESLTVSAKLISVSRATRVRELVDRHQLGLKEPKDPIYKIGK